MPTEKLFTAKKNYYGTNERAEYMGSSIELAHHDVKRVGLTDKSHSGAAPGGNGDRMQQFRNHLTADFQDEVKLPARQANARYHYMPGSPSRNESGAMTQQPNMGGGLGQQPGNAASARAVGTFKNNQYVHQDQLYADQKSFIMQPLQWQGSSELPDYNKDVPVKAYHDPAYSPRAQANRTADQTGGQVYTPGQGGTGLQHARRSPDINSLIAKNNFELAAHTAESRSPNQSPVAGTHGISPSKAPQGIRQANSGTLSMVGSTDVKPKLSKLEAYK